MRFPAVRQTPPTHDSEQSCLNASMRTQALRGMPRKVVIGQSLCQDIQRCGSPATGAWPVLRSHDRMYDVAAGSPSILETSSVVTRIGRYSLGSTPTFDASLGALRDKVLASQGWGWSGAPFKDDSNKTKQDCQPSSLPTGMVVILLIDPEGDAHQGGSAFTAASA